MIRIVKFRGKRLDNGQWLYGNLQVPKKKNVPYFMCDKRGFQREVDPATVGQFTGLIDKDSKEVYEGDLLESPLHDRPLVVRFIGSGFCIVNSNLGAFGVIERLDEAYFSSDHCLKVVGNYTDNPEFMRRERHE